MREGHVITGDGAELYFRQVSSGASTLLVPDAAFLCEQLAALSHGRSVIFYDVRNRGRSQTIAERERLVRGIHQDVDDLEAVRRHFSGSSFSGPSVQLLGHSYWGVVVALHALRYGHVERIVQIAPPPPDASRKYPAALQWRDEISREFAANLATLQVQRHLRPTAELHAELMAWLRRLMVLDSADVAKVCWNDSLPNEAAACLHLNQYIMPTLQALRLDRGALSQLTVPVLIIHGCKDRQAPYGGGVDWAAGLPNARLLTIEEAAHAPWIEAPQQVFTAIETFLQGGWPQQAQIITSEGPGNPR
jgi:pimeloyl-ACP methyl ester carboxylesterase